MSQADTLADIYGKIADIYDRFCNLSVSTFIESQYEILSDEWTAPAISLYNIENKQEITDAQNALNTILVNTKNVVEQNELELQIESSLELPALPRNTAISKLVKLIGVIVGQLMPLETIITIIIDFVKELLLEEIRSGNTKKAKIYNIRFVSSTGIVSIPDSAIGMVFSFRNIPSWMGKIFSPTDLNYGEIQPSPNETPDYSRYIRRLGFVSIGIALNDSDTDKTPFLQTPIDLEFQKQFLLLDRLDKISNLKRYAYVYLESPIEVYIGYWNAS